LQQADVVGRNDNVVEPDPADVTRRCFGDVEVNPKVVEAQLVGRPPAEAFERPPAFRYFEALPGAFRVIPADAFTTLTRHELVEHPFPLRKTLAEVADRLAVDPEGHLAVRVLRVVHLHHELDANPPAPLDFEPGVADETVAPRLTLRRAAAHLAPVSVVVPDPTPAERLDAHGKRLIPAGSQPRAALRPRRGRVVTADVRAEMMDRSAFGIELDVEPGMQFFVAGFEVPIEMPAIPLAAGVRQEQRALAAAALRHVW